MDLDQRIAELTAKMLRRKLYAVISQPSPVPQKLKPLLPAHLEYMIELEKRGLLLAEADPFVAHGLRTFELKEWTIMEGSLGLKVNLSDQSIEVA
jgi:hypothetical protein